MHIQWKDKYSVYIEQIDDQHKRIFDMINRLHDAIKKRRSREVIGQVLSELVDYTYYHFATEEKYFLRHLYPGSDVHKSEHDLMRSLTAGQRRRFDAGNDQIALELMDLLKDWLSDHVLGSDQKFGSFLRTKRES